MYNEEDRSQYEYHYDYQHDQPEVNLEPWTSPAPPKKRIWPKVVAGALCASLLLGGAFGAGWLFSDRDGGTGSKSGRDGLQTQLQVSDRQKPEVQTVNVNAGQKLTFPEIYAANVDSCVSIYVVSSAGYNIFNQRVVQASSGSGFIISQDGYIVTNYHVVSGGSSVEVTLNDGATYEAEIVGGDADYDVAVLKIDPDGATLKSVVIGSSQDLLVGDDVVTIGNPLGELTFSLSDGRVSCLDREINVDGTPFNMIQITAPVNHGNSGGPLFNVYGEVVGIVSAKYGNTSSTDSVEGLGFAIPIDDVLSMIQDIIENGQVTSRAWLGVEADQTTSRFPQSSSMVGAYVGAVTPGGPAEAAGLQAGDIITMLGTTQISSWTDLQSAVGSKSFQAGDTTTVTFIRDGRVYTTEVTFGSTADMPQDTTQPEQDDAQSGQDVQPYPGFGDMEDFFDYFFGGMYGGR